jgi:hypothetical protein
MSRPVHARDGRRPGDSSAKTSHRASSPNHQDDSKETPMVEPIATSAAPSQTGVRR